MLRCITVPRGVSTLHTDASGTAPPDAFGPFRVLHQIGAGVLGPVYRAYQPDPGRLVAVKQFRLDLPPETSHRFVAALDQSANAGVIIQAIVALGRALGMVVLIEGVETEEQRVLMRRSLRPATTLTRSASDARPGSRRR